MASSPVTQVDDIDVLTFSDGGDWNGIADIGQYSIALIDADSDNSLGSNWSIQSVFTTPGAENIFSNSGPSPLVINEIHYNPIAGTPYEFIEIVNTSEEPFAMQGVSFTDGITYTFTSAFSLAPASQYPGNYLVLAEDAAIFQAAYGFAPYGQYGGKLSNDGELLVLQGAQGEILDALTYNDAPPWDTVPDAGLHSLALLDPGLDNAMATNWGHQEENVTPGSVNFPQADDCPEDFDQDGIIGVGDFVAFNSNFGINCNGCPFDLDGSGLVDVADFLLFNSSYGQTCPTQFQNPDDRVLNGLLNEEIQNLENVNLNPELTKVITELRNTLSLSVFPNPTDGTGISFRLTNYSSKQDLIVTLMDITGKRLQRTELNHNSISSLQGEISFNSPLAKGLYMLEIVSGDQRGTSRFLVH
jgi:hypothetical protein